MQTKDLLKMNLESCMGMILPMFSEEDLDTASQACPPEYEAFFGTYRQCFQQIANHWWMHQGQVADARRAAGRKPLMA